MRRAGSAAKEDSLRRAVVAAVTARADLEPLKHAIIRRRRVLAMQLWP